MPGSKILNALQKTVLHPFNALEIKEGRLHGGEESGLGIGLQDS